MSPEWKRQRRRIRALLKKWRFVLTLDEWDITNNFVDGPIVVDGEVSSDAVASARVRWEYRRATLSWNTQEVAKLNDADLEEVFLHESMHVLLNEMREVVAGNIKAEERSATTFALVVRRVLEMTP